MITKFANVAIENISTSVITEWDKPNVDTYMTNDTFTKKLDKGTISYKYILTTAEVSDSEYMVTLNLVLSPYSLSTNLYKEVEEDLENELDYIGLSMNGNGVVYIDSVLIKPVVRNDIPTLLFRIMSNIQSIDEKLLSYLNNKINNSGETGLDIINKSVFS